MHKNGYRTEVLPLGSPWELPRCTGTIARRHSAPSTYCYEQCSPELNQLLSHDEMFQTALHRHPEHILSGYDTNICSSPNGRANPSSPASQEVIDMHNTPSSSLQVSHSGAYHEISSHDLPLRCLEVGYGSGNAKSMDDSRKRTGSAYCNPPLEYIPLQQTQGMYIWGGAHESRLMNQPAGLNPNLSVGNLSQPLGGYEHIPRYGESLVQNASQAWPSHNGIGIDDTCPNSSLDVPPMQTYTRSYIAPAHLGGYPQLSFLPTHGNRIAHSMPAHPGMGPRQSNVLVNQSSNSAEAAQMHMNLVTRSESAGRDYSLMGHPSSDFWPLESAQYHSPRVI